jgi:uncharacterized protein YidB (DUF937 family)
MGLLDILNGMQNGPRGQAPGQGSGSGGMSPITMAILGLLAYKAVKHFGGQNQAPAGNTAPQRLPDTSTNTTQAGLPGGLGDLMKGGLGGLLAGGAAGSVLSGGLNDLLNQFQQAGHGETAGSWIGKGENKQISASDLSSVLSPDQLETLAQQTGLSQNDLLAGLSRELPAIIDQLTPHGSIPTPDEFSKFR